jgi:copper chaperone
VCPYIELSRSPEAKGRRLDPKSTEKTMTHTLSITGMSCGHCVRAVTSALESVAGVESVAVDLELGRARVEGQADAAALIAAVVAEGYGAEPASHE